MAKTISTSRNPNYHLHARLSHLYQASTILAAPSGEAPAHDTLSRFYLNNFRAIAKKSVTRLDPSVKRTICKRCDSLLVEGVSSTHRIENTSKGGRKPWADVLVVECNACGATKRFPVGMDILKEKRGKKFILWSERGDQGGVLTNGEGGPQKKKKGQPSNVFRPEISKLPNSGGSIRTESRLNTGDVGAESKAVGE